MSNLVVTTELAELGAEADAVHLGDISISGSEVVTPPWTSEVSSTYYSLTSRPTGRIRLPVWPAPVIAGGAVVFGLLAWLNEQLQALVIMWPVLAAFFTFILSRKDRSETMTISLRSAGKFHICTIPVEQGTKAGTALAEIGALLEAAGIRPATAMPIAQPPPPGYVPPPPGSAPSVAPSAAGLGSNGPSLDSLGSFAGMNLNDGLSKVDEFSGSKPAAMLATLFCPGLGHYLVGDSEGGRHYIRFTIGGYLTIPIFGLGLAVLLYAAISAFSDISKKLP